MAKEFKKYVMKDSSDYRPDNNNHEVLLINSVNGQDIAFGRFTTIDEDMLDLTEEELEKIKEFSRPIPNISLRQCRELLIRKGRFQEVTSIINSIEDETERLVVENYFNNSQEFERNHHMLGLITTALGMSEIEVDDFFLEASEL